MSCENSIKEKISSIKSLALGQIFLINTLFQNVGRMAGIFLQVYVRSYRVKVSLYCTYYLDW